MVKKGSIYVLVLALLFLAVTGCGPTKQSANPPGKVPSASEAPKKTVALVMKTLTNPFFIKMEQGARRAEREFGIKLIVKTGAQETSIDQQIAIVEELTAAKVDAIVIAPGSSTELIPALKKAQDTGIAIVNIDNRIDPAVAEQMGLKTVPFISVDNEHGMYLSVKYVSDQIKKPTEAILLEGIPEAKNAQERKAGALRAIKENPKLRLVGTQSAHWKIDEAMKVTSDFFNDHPNIEAIFCANDMMALGSIEYLQQSGKTGLPVAGFDALEEAKSALKKGTLTVTIDQNAEQQGYMGVATAMKMLQGKTVPPETLINVKVVTRKTVE
ncbi:MAG: sugar ABC transporter substrate-binding protein [Solirubrobacterales bacterium]